MNAKADPVPPVSGEPSTEDDAIVANLRKVFPKAVARIEAEARTTPPDEGRDRLEAALRRIALGLDGRKDSGLLPHEVNHNGLPLTDWELAGDALGEQGSAE